MHSEPYTIERCLLKLLKQDHTVALYVSAKEKLNEAYDLLLESPFLRRADNRIGSNFHLDDLHYGNILKDILKNATSPQQVETETASLLVETARALDDAFIEALEALRTNTKNHTRHNELKKRCEEIALVRLQIAGRAGDAMLNAEEPYQNNTIAKINAIFLDALSEWIQNPSDNASLKRCEAIWSLRIRLAGKPDEKTLAYLYESIEETGNIRLTERTADRTKWELANLAGDPGQFCEKLARLAGKPPISRARA